MKGFHWKHKNLILFFLGILIACLIFRSQWFHNLLLDIGNFGYVGAFLAGMLFTSTFTIATGGMMLLNLAKILPAFPLVILAGLGAVTCDFLIFKFFRNTIVEEITPIYEELEKIGHKNHLKKIIHTKYFGWTLPVIGALIILSPLPDELGVSLLGISDIKTARFLLISICSHSLGMFLIVSAAALV